MLPWILIGIAMAMPAYAYGIYPLILKVIGGRTGPDGQPPERPDWPLVSITIPAYNEEANIARAIEALLALDYPADRKQILVISDASTDRTDEIVRGYAGRGVELLRMPKRSGKTAAENAARTLLRGEFVVQTDASTLVHPASLKPLIAAFDDPRVGVASGRDVSVARAADQANAGESGYVGYEMWVRQLETQVYGIVGASGCYYASRMDLHREIVPEALSRDFAAPLVAREHGFRSVSVHQSLCAVPRTSSLLSEYRRKVRTMTRGIETLFYKRHLMNPFRYGVFAWMLLSHKLARWLVPIGVVPVLIALVLLGRREPFFYWLLAAAIWAAASAMAVVLWWPRSRKMPRALALPVFAIAGIVAGLHAWINAARGELNPVWEPTRRPTEASHG